MNLSSGTPIVDASRYVKGNPPMRKRMINGEIVTERVPNEVVRRTITMLDAKGHVLDCVLSCAASAPGKGEFADYLRQKWAGKGWLQYGRCAVAQYQAREIPGWAIPQEMHTERACDPDTVGPRKPCKHVIAIEALRRAQNAAENTEAERRHKSQDQKILEATQASSSEVAKAVAAEVAKAVAQLSPPRGPVK